MAPKRFASLPQRNRELERIYGRHMRAYAEWLAGIARAAMREEKARAYVLAGDADDDGDDIAAVAAVAMAAILAVLGAPQDAALGMPAPPAPETVAAQGRLAAVRRARAEVRRLLAKGYPRELLAERLGIPVGDLLTFSTLTAEQELLLANWTSGGLGALADARAALRSRMTKGFVRVVTDRGKLADLDKVVTDIVKGPVKGKNEDGTTKRGADAERHGAIVADGIDADLNARIRKLAQTRAGVTHAICRTRRDNRVRPEHRRAEGEMYALDGPGIPGFDTNGGSAFPGEPYGCRCDGEPILPEGLGIGETEPEIEVRRLDQDALRDPAVRAELRRRGLGPEEATRIRQELAAAKV